MKELDRSIKELLELMLRHKKELMNIPTAEEILLEHSTTLTDGSIYCSHVDREKAMIRFAKLHVEAALKAASENLEYTSEDSSERYVVESSILNTYPLNNIK